MSKIEISSPTRVDLAGGTLDCWPLYLLIGDCLTVNLSIDIKTFVELVPRDGTEIELDISDLNYKKKFKNLDEVLNCNDEELSLIHAHLDYQRPDKGFYLKTKSQSPVGGGLGGSSSLCISLLRAFHQFMGKDMNVDELVRVASGLEAQILKKPTGTQDYFPAVNPGLSIIHYGVGGPRQEKLKVSGSALSDHLMLVYTGKAHHSGINNWEVIKAAVEGHKPTVDGLKALQSISKEMAQVCREESWKDFPRLFNEEYGQRVRLAESFASPEIAQLEKLVLQAGADAVKICGAGGGGCVLVWCSPEKQQAVRDACQKENFQVLKANPILG